MQLTGSGTLQLVTSSLAPDASHIEALGSGANISIDANLVTNGNLLIKTNGGSSQVINNKLVDAGGTLQVHTRFLRLSQNSTMQGHGVKVTNNADVDIVGPGTAKTATLQSLGAGNTLSIVPSANNKNITFSGSGGTIILDSDAQVLIGEKPIPTNNVVVSPTVVITGTRATAVTVTTATIGSYFQNGSQITYNSGQLLIDTSTVKFGANSLLKAMTVQILTNNPLVIQASSGNSAIESLVGNVFFQGSTGLQFVTLSGNSTINIIAPSHMFTTLAGDIIVGPKEMVPLN